MRRTSAFFWITVLACVLYVCAFGFTVYALASHFGARKDPGWSAGVSRGVWIVSRVDPSGPAAGLLQAGDRLVRFNGNSRVAILGPYRLLRLDVDERYRVETEREGRRSEVELSIAGHPAPRGSLLFLITSVTVFACGAALGLLGTNRPPGPLFSASMMLVGLSMLTDVLNGTWTRAFLDGWESVVFVVILSPNGWQFPMLYHFASQFPTGISPGRVWTAVQWLLYIAALLVLWPATMAGYLVNSLNAEAALAFLTRHPALYPTSVAILRATVQPYLTLCIALAVVAVLANYRRLSDVGSRRRIRWFVAGVVVGVTPWLILMTFLIVGAVSQPTFSALYPVVSLAVTAIPMCTAVAVWKEQLFDIHVVIRRGLQYLLARNALRALLLLPVIALALSILTNRDRTIVQILTGGWAWLNLGAMAALAVGLQYRQTVQTALDRRFFREAYREEQVLLQLIEEIRIDQSMPAIARLVTGRIESVLHPTAVHVFCRTHERREMIAAHSSPGGLSDHHLSDQDALLRILDGIRSPQDFPFKFDVVLPPGEHRWLDDLRVRLIVPMLGPSDRLVGLLLLGAKLSDQPYSAMDRRLLQRIGAQIGVTYEGQPSRGRLPSADDVTRQVAAAPDRPADRLKECPTCGACYEGTASRCAADGAELASTLPVERTIDRKYRLERRLGAGGMGAVYEATDLRLERRVAAKILTRALFGDRLALRRFEREARAAARLDHANITRIYDTGSIGTDGAYLIMELVAGRTWRAELQRAGAIHPALAADWFQQLLDGVHLAHEAGIVHRDLKPENVMLTPAPGGERVKIMDFGLAKVRGPGSSTTETVTQAGFIVGTIGYMAPEEIGGADVDPRADLFSIGVMVVESLTGQRPFRGRTPQEIMSAVLRDSYQLPGDGVDVQALDRIVQRCLAKDPSDRHGTAAELARDLVPALRACPALGRDEHIARA